MTRTVNIEVYCDKTEGERDLFGVYSEHRPDFPDQFDTKLQAWVRDNFDHLTVGESIEEAGELEYETDGAVVEFRAK